MVTVHPGPSLARQAQRLNLSFQPRCQRFVKSNFVLDSKRNLWHNYEVSRGMNPRMLTPDQVGRLVTEFDVEWDE